MERFSRKLVWAAACALLVTGCKINRDDETAPAPPPPPPAPTPTEQPAPAPANDVVRYSGAEVPDQGTLTVRNTVRARKAADFSSEIIATLGPGSEVDRVARYGGFTLVAWTGDDGEQQGWVDAVSATRSVALVPTTTATVTTTTTTPAPAVVVKPASSFKPVFTPKTAPTPAPTPTPSPKPTATTKAPSLGTPKPPTTATGTKTTFKPPKLGK